MLFRSCATTNNKSSSLQCMSKIHESNWRGSEISIGIECFSHQMSDVSAAQMEVEDLRKANVELLRRVEAAENLALLLQVDFIIF